MRISLASLSDESQTFDLEAPAAAIGERLETGEDATLRVREPVRARIEAYRAGDDVVVAGAVETTFVGVCARCAEAFDLPLKAPIQILLVPPGSVEQEDLDRGEGAVATLSGEEIDLTPLCFDQLLLAIPSRLLCDEACLGLCPWCGANRNSEHCDCRPPDTTASRRLASLAEQLSAHKRRG